MIFSFDDDDLWPIAADASPKMSTTGSKSFEGERSGWTKLLEDASERTSEKGFGIGCVVGGDRGGDSSWSGGEISFSPEELYSAFPCGRILVPLWFCEASKKIYTFNDIDKNTNTNMQPPYTNFHKMMQKRWKTTLNSNTLHKF